MKLLSFVHKLVPTLVYEMISGFSLKLLYQMPIQKEIFDA